MSQLDIRAFGANNIEELVQTLGPQVASNRGRADDGSVTLLNGRRVSSFAEIGRIPTEAVERVEIFPEEVALKYGFRADQKVTNIVTFRKYSSTIGQIGTSEPTSAGGETYSVTSDYFAIEGDARYSLGIDYSLTMPILESQRDVSQPAGSPDLARSRTLLPEIERFTVNGLVSGSLLEGIGSTINIRHEAIDNESLLGLGSTGPLRLRSATHSTTAGTTQNGRLGEWSWTLTGGYARVSTRNLIDADFGGERNTARSVNQAGNADVVFAGPFLQLPAGPAFASIRGGFESRNLDSTSNRAGAAVQTRLSRDQGAILVNLDLPVLGIDKGPAFLGRVTANANLGLEKLSDFGSLRTVGYGVSWSPIAALNVIASVTDEEGAPTINQLGAPVIETPNIRTFDFSRREVVDISRLSGGNPALLSDDRRVVRLGLNAQPMRKTNLTFSADFVSTRIDNPIASFPIPIQAVEAAFPERFVRADDGRLLSIDDRPINFKRIDQRQLRLGVNLTRPLGPVPPVLQSLGRVFSNEADARRAYPGATVIVGTPGGPLARQAANISSRLFVSLYNNWILKDQVVTVEGGPTLDLLNGDAVSFRGGRSRHEVELEAGIFKRGLGVRTSVNWRSGTSIRGLADATGSLGFSSLATLNLNAFANIAEYLGVDATPDWLKGTRATLGVVNIFDARPRVRDETGATPLSFQSAYLAPIGRSVFLSLRKRF